MDLSRSSNLDFTSQISLAQSALEEGYGAIVWQCSLFDENKLDDEIDPLDRACISALQLALRTFIEQLPEDLTARTLGLIIDSIDLLKPLRGKSTPIPHSVQEFIAAFCQSHGLEEKSFSRLHSLDAALFTLDLYDGLWALIACHCPDEWHSFLRIQKTSLSKAEEAFLFSRPIFEHLLPIVEEGDPQLVPMALHKDKKRDWQVLPQENAPHIGVLCPIFPSSSRKEFLEFFHKSFAKTSTPYRLVPESRLMHLWQDLHWVVCPYVVSDKQTLRQIKGFLAAGGEAIYYSNLESAGAGISKSSALVLEKTRALFSQDS